MKSRPLKELQDALENLAIFSAFSADSLFSSSKALRVRDGKIISVSQNTVKKILDVTRVFLAGAFSCFSAYPKDDLYRTVALSRDLVKEHAFLLFVWEVGTAEQRRFATYARRAIERFNETIEKVNQTPSLFKLFYGENKEDGTLLSRIDLTFSGACIHATSSTQYDPLKIFAKAPSSINTKVSQLRSAFLPVQAKELFMMKAISLLEANGIATHSEARQLVRSGTVQTENLGDGIHTLSLTFQLPYGRQIEIQGSFMGRIPLTDCFHVSVGLTAAI